VRLDNISSADSATRQARLWSRFLRRRRDPDYLEQGHSDRQVAAYSVDFRVQWE